MKKAVWVTARGSNGNGGNNCVEVMPLDTVIAVRDSKDRTGPILRFNPEAWDAFIQSIKKNEFDR